MDIRHWLKQATATLCGGDSPKRDAEILLGFVTGKSRSWLIAFDPTKDIAVGCLVVNAGYGAQFAGPEVAAFLNAF